MAVPGDDRVGAVRTVEGFECGQEGGSSDDLEGRVRAEEGGGGHYDGGVSGGVAAEGGKRGCRAYGGGSRYL